MAADYNPSAPRPTAPFAWRALPLGRRVMVVVITAVLLATIAMPFDHLISHPFAGDLIHGDFKRELEALQQFGGIGSLLMTSVLILLLDPARRRTIANMIAASIVTVLAANVLKLFLGRPRPTLDDPLHVTFPWQTYFLNDHGDIVQRHAWEFWRSNELHLSEIWSMPSSHTAAATALAMYLTYTYPRLKPFGIAMIVAVGSARILLHAHYPSDVIIGAALGYTCAAVTLERNWGLRLLYPRTPSVSERA